MERLLRIPSFKRNCGDITKVFTLHGSYLRIIQEDREIEFLNCQKYSRIFSFQIAITKNTMEEVSLATAEVKEKITHLLGKQSSHLFVCFCRVLYAKKEDRYTKFILLTVGQWIDDNLTGFLAGIITRGLVTGFPIYSALLFDYNVIFRCESQ